MCPVKPPTPRASSPRALRSTSPSPACTIDAGQRHAQRRHAAAGNGRYRSHASRPLSAETSVAAARTIRRAMRYREARTPQHMQTSRGIKAATGILFAALAALGASLSATQVSSNDDLATLRRAFDAPPDDARIMMRWWWFGPQVTDEELGRELQAMKDARHRRRRGAAGLPGRARRRRERLEDRAVSVARVSRRTPKFAADRAAASACASISRSAAAGPTAGRPCRSTTPPAACAIERVPIPAASLARRAAARRRRRSVHAGVIVAPGAWTRLDPSGAPTSR